MASFSLSEAARMWGVSRATINRYRKSGKISVMADGSSVTVDASEMIRVFGQTKHADTASSSTDTVSLTQVETGADTAILSETVELLKQQIADLRDSLAHARQSENELRGIVDRQTRLLTDQRASTGLFARWFKR